ncbi:MAG: hypothetical protein AB7O80_08080 [Acetobacteraceae bacterium]
MRRLLTACGLSLLLYVTACAFVLDRPLSLGFLRQQLDAKIARGAAIGSPKLVIIAGSNGPYSHRCETIEPILGLPCVNAGVAVGIGLDMIFARWQPLLHQGDTVYLPLEEAQYVRPRSAITLGPDAAMMLRHDRATLLTLPPDRWIAALFASDLRALVMAVIETSLVVCHFVDPRAEVTGTTNRWGDHIGHTASLARTSLPALMAASPNHPAASAIANGAGTADVTRFLTWAHRHGVRVVGGLPTGFADVPIPLGTLAALRALYESHGARLLILSNQSRYPRDRFFDTPDHLNEAAQIAHSRTVALALRQQVADMGPRGWEPARHP